MNNKQRKLEFIRFKNKVRLLNVLQMYFKVSNQMKDDVLHLESVIKHNINDNFIRLNKRVKADYEYKAIDISFNWLDDDFPKDLTTYKVNFKRVVN